jgi:eukaryotic-like serine/threonine-protein kinase
VKLEPAIKTRILPPRAGVGTQLGRYELLSRVAHGGMASVWAAREKSAGRERLVAVKMVLPDLAGSEFEAMFLEEARLAALIQHRNVCQIFELIDQQGILALAMEWIDGGTLAGLLAASTACGPLDRRVTADILAQVACGLHAAHEQRDDNGIDMQLVHRDVSPQNVLIGRDGRVTVTDFGVAKALGRAGCATAVGTLKGKLAYMSPEQVNGEPVDRRSDIFALGVVLYVATVGTHPFRRPGEPHRQMFTRLNQPLTPPSELAPGYPAELEAIVARALQRNPDQRFATAEELRSELLAWIARSGPAVGAPEIAAAVNERLGPPKVGPLDGIAHAERPTVIPGRRGLPGR